MKRVSILALCISMIFFGCKKYVKEQEQGVEALITGSWELRKITGAMSGPIEFPAENGNILKFTGIQFEKYVNGVLTETGQYTITGDNTVEENVCLDLPAGSYPNRVIYDSSSISRKVFFEVSKNKLTLVSGCFASDGGHIAEYERQKNSN